MTKADTARQNYATAREELLHRTILRDTLLAAYLAAMGAIFAVALGQERAHPEILLIVPYLSLGASVLVAQHHALIGAIAQFLSKELEPAFKLSGEDVIHWDNSIAKKKSRTWALRARFLGHCFLLLIPPVAALIWNRNDFCGTKGRGMALLSWLGLAATLGATISTYLGHRFRVENETQD